MADLDARLILAQRPLPSPQDMADERQKRQIQQQEVDLRAQEIAMRGEALRQAAMQRGQKLAPEADPAKMKQALEYRILQGETVAHLLQRAKDDPSQYQAVRQSIGSLVGPDALEYLPPEYDEAFVSGAISDGLAHIKQAKQEAAKTREITVVNPDGSKTTKIVEDKPGQEFTSANVPTATPGAQGFTLAPGGRRYDATGKLIAEAPERPEKAGGPAGPKPRSVTSGDANKIADFNDSLKTVGVLKDTISGVAGATGNAAALGAALPNFVTNITGWGVTAKEKQAVIDRVKQVIGKSLEGGVLRKEDEEKYKKILPVISDPPEVVTSKLNGLRAAIEQKRDEHLSSLEDAGYDTGKFRARIDSAPPPDKKTDDGLTVTAPNGKVYRFTSKAQADVFKKRAGIR